MPASLLSSDDGNRMGAYQLVPGANLTDTNIGYTRERLIEPFGSRGLDWNLRYEPIKIF
jgi:hypothetical protein